MLCLEVFLNGERLCAAGVRDDGGVQALVTWSSVHPPSAPRPARTRRTEAKLIVTGTECPDPLRHARLQWLDRPIGEGDEITIRLIAPTEADEPPLREVASAAGIREGPRRHDPHAARFSMPPASARAGML